MSFKALGENVTIHEPSVILKPEMVEIGDGARIDSFVKIEGGQGVTLGRWVHVGSFAHVNIGGGRLIVGEGVAICSGAKVLSGSNMKSGEFMSCAAPADRQVIERRVTVLEDQSYVGSGAIVLPGLRLGRGAVVGAGAVVTHDVPPWEIWAGVPAKRIGMRERAP